MSFNLLLKPTAHSQTQCPADAPNGFTFEEVGDSCYIVFTWPKTEMPELTCGSPGTPVAGSAAFKGKLINLTLNGTDVVYENGNNCTGSTFNFAYHSTLADSYITTRSYCDLTELSLVSFVANRTQGSNFTCDQENNGLANAPTPIELGSFTATLDKSGQVNLNWVTEWEENNAFFQIERSEDAKTFDSIAKLAGKGDADFEQYYQYQDFYPSTGLNYYRLKQVDYDGQFSYSPIVSVNNITGIKAWNCYPTVTSGPITIANESYDEGSAVAQVFDVLGRPVLPVHQLTGLEKNDLDLSSLPVGSYLIVLIEQESVRHHFPVIIKR